MITTVIVRYKINKPEQGIAGEWYTALQEATEKTKGFIDRTELPMVSGENFHLVILRFKTADYAQEWLQQDIRKELLTKAGLEDISQVNTALHESSEFWFKRTANIPRWKQAILSFIAVYPLTQIVPLGTQYLFKSLAFHSPVLSGLLIAATISLLMVYLAMPFVLKLLKKWV